MSSTPNWIEICNSETSASICADDFCDRQGDSVGSPIDDLIEYFGSVMPLGDRQTLESNDVLGRVLLLGLVSGTETYFRSVLARLVNHCPFSSAHAGSQMLSLASAQYYGSCNLGHALLERVSFSSSGELAKATSKLTGLKIPDRSSVTTAIEQFEMLCHFRHAAVHARGELNAANLKAVGVESDESPTHLILRLGQLHEAADVCLNAARAYNRYMFRSVVERWIAKRHLKGNWEADKSDFTRLISVFRSQEDGYGGKTHTNWLYGQLRPAIISAMGSGLST